MGANPLLGSPVTGQQSAVYSFKMQETPKRFRLSSACSNAGISLKSFFVHQNLYPALVLKWEDLC